MHQAIKGKQKEERAERAIVGVWEQEVAETQEKQAEKS